MGIEEPDRLYRGPPHAWRVPVRARPMSFLLFAVAALVVLVELFFVGAELGVHGRVLAPTARGFAILGIVLLIAANMKSIALALRREANESLAGLVDVALDRLWLMHFWLNPLGLFSLGLFLVFAPRAQPPFYYIAYGVLLWQAVGGLLAREAVPLKSAKGERARVARRAHHQPAVYVLLTVLVVVGWVDSIFP
jgi:hypothetical protein